MISIIHIVQIVISVLIIGCILLQQRGAEGLGSAFGGDSGGSAYRTRRGLEQGVFIATIVLSIVFVILALLSITVV
jgi:protein translocase SecG subunit